MLKYKALFRSKYLCLSFARQYAISYTNFIIGFLVEIEAQVSVSSHSLIFKCFDNPSPISRTVLLSKMFNLSFVPRIFKYLNKHLISRASHVCRNYTYQGVCCAETHVLKIPTFWKNVLSEEKHRTGIMMREGRENCSRKLALFHYSF